MSEALCDYEKQRLENIKRNQAVLEALGLVQSDAIKHDELRNAPKAKKQKADPNGPEAQRAAVRRSMRLAGVPADDNDAEADALSSGAISAERGDHTQARADYDLYSQRWCQKQAGVTVVGTASYSHTLMRVMTMSETGLANRINAIERACGYDCTCTALSCACGLLPRFRSV